ncbi:toprim domain-containing protein [Larkinella sp. C7]|uniref:toprim domain-containing protein n=1 Tax=Larkinella sp. C7 TaxID=2576607 RepID=UPI00111148BA|nr:toprim domain-containing protein [Larkinella sp. C7]
MNSNQAKRIPIADFLRRIGATQDTAKSTDSDKWFYSPFREERSASFKVNIEKNVWSDYGGAGKQGGNITDLVMKLYNVDFSGALKVLDKETPGIDRLPNRPTEQPAANSRQNRILKVAEINKKPLITYLTDVRRIPIDLARIYAVECTYTSDDRLSRGLRHFYAIGFRNDQGGYELRNPQFKGGTSPKGITTIPGEDRQSVNVFEGFISFLSALVLLKGKDRRFINDVIVLNSLSFVNDELILTLQRYRTVNLFLDNDESGKKAASCVLSSIPYAVDYSPKYYPQHKDFNDFLTAQPHE